MKGLAFLLSLALSSQLSADIYKWTDEQGRVHYGDRASGEDAQAMKIRAAPESGNHASTSSEAQRAERRQRLLDIYREERAEKEAARERSRQEAEQRRQNCRSARLEYDRYVNSRAVYDFRDNGERRFLSDREREDLIEKLRQAVKRWCG